MMKKDKMQKKLIIDDFKADVADVFEKYISECDLKDSPYDELYLTRLHELRDLYYAEDRKIELGQLVEWKPGLRNKRYPEYRQPAIVMEFLEEPVYDSREQAGSTYYRESLDVILGLFDKDNDFVTFHFDSRRFMMARTVDSIKNIEEEDRGSRS